MLSRVFHAKPRWSPRRDGNNISCKLGSILEYSEDCIVGFIDDLPLVFCGNDNNNNNSNISDYQESQLTLREVLRASVAVMGESRLGMTEKVVLLEGKIFTVKRFRKVSIGRREFGKRVERLAQVTRKCDYLVPITAYLHAKRIKFVLCDYYPMGSLTDLLAGERVYGHTALDWNQRLMIALDIVRAIAFIHTQCPPYGKNMQMNVHGNIKASNVMINSNFTACLSDYGFAQLAEFGEDSSDTWQRKQPPQQPPAESSYCDKCCQKSDIYNFGIILLDMLGGPSEPGLTQCIGERKEETGKDGIQFFEFQVEGTERQQALKVLDVALACTNKSAEARPSIEQILRVFGETIIKK